ncbi:lipoate--protein ligase family protein [Bacteroides sp. f07]|uniref:lipoate--protein ligase family protein n=1 Tax=Bacteroides sp. f07 TaxID=3132704 RepID=UPI0034B75404
MIRCIYSPYTDIYFHLAAEEYLLKQGNDDVFMLWQDTPSVVIGKHQRLQSEVDTEWAERERIHIARRFSGGGTVYHDLGNVNLTFIETVSRLPEFITYLQRTLDFLASIGVMAEGDERLGIYLDGLKISGSAQCVHKDRVLYHCTLLYDTNLTVLNKVLNPEPLADDETLSSVYAVPSVRSEVTNIRKHFSVGTVDDFKENVFQYFSKSQRVSSFSEEEIVAANQLRNEKYIGKEWIYSR